MNPRENRWNPYDATNNYRLLGSYILKLNFARFSTRLLTMFLNRFLNRNTGLQYYRDRQYSIQFF